MSDIFNRLPLRAGALITAKTNSHDVSLNDAAFHLPGRERQIWNYQQVFMKIEVSEVGSPSQTSHSQSLSGREDCGGWDLLISGVGLNKTEKKRKDVTEIGECQSKAFELKSWSLTALNILHVFVHFLQISLRYRQWFKLFKPRSLRKNESTSDELQLSLWKVGVSGNI